MTATTPESAKRRASSFWFLGTAANLAEAIIDTVAKLRAEGKVGRKLAMLSVADEFGIMHAKAARRLLKKRGFELVYDRSYPVELRDLRPMMTEVKQSNPDVFIAFSYPPDTIAITEQARALGFIEGLLHRCRDRVSGVQAALSAPTSKA